MIIPYGIQTYSRSDLPKIELANMYVEKVPSTPNKLTLMMRPGMEAYQENGDGPSRGVYYQAGSLDGSLLHVSGQEVFNDGVSLGMIDGTQQVDFGATINIALIATELTLYSTDGSNLNTVAFPDGAAVQSLAYLGGYMFAARKGTRRIYFTLDPLTWDGLDYVSAEQQTGAIIGFAVVGDQLWVFCEEVTEIFTLTGDPDIPISPLGGRVFPKGCASRDSIVVMDNSVLWAGNDNVVYRGDNVPVRVSDHGIEEEISNTTTYSAWYLPWKGHSFYILRLDSGTFVLDLATQQWTEFASEFSPGVPAPWRGVHGILYGREVVAADAFSGKVWKLRDGLYEDDGEDIVRTFTVMVDEKGFLDNISLDCSTGETSGDPGILRMRTSRDKGITWGAWREVSLGANGDYRQRVAFRRVGFVDNEYMTLQFQTRSRVLDNVQTIRVNEAFGGRSR